MANKQKITNKHHSILIFVVLTIVLFGLAYLLGVVADIERRKATCSSVANLYDQFSALSIFASGVSAVIVFILSFRSKKWSLTIPSVIFATVYVPFATFAAYFMLIGAGLCSLKF